MGAKVDRQNIKTDVMNKFGESSSDMVATSGDSESLPATSVASEEPDNALFSVLGPYRLCGACHAIVLSMLPNAKPRPARTGCVQDTRLPHHQSREQLMAAVEGQCPLCVRAVFELEAHEWPPLRRGDAIFVKVLMTEPVCLRFDFQQVVEPVRPFQRGSVFQVSFAFHEIRSDTTLEGKIHANQPVPTGSVCSTGDIEARAWMQTCDTSHSCLRDRKSSYIPPRLLDCAGPKPRLVEATELSVDRPSVDYIALSHCWGSTSSPMLLETDNIRDFYHEIDLKRLPKSFTDAIEITKKLGVRFLWIDSLCIIQKGARHKEDWERHVRVIADIYSNCYVNLAASHANNPHGGCFQSRPSPFSSPFILGIRGLLVTIEREKYPRIEGFRLNDRAWVFQERLLAPRALHYASHDVFWECKELFASGQYPAGVPGRKPTAISTTAPFEWQVPEVSKFDLNWHWNILIQVYAEKSITFAGDRLPAMAGIAQRFNDRYLREPYVAGYFLSQLPLGLLWWSLAYLGTPLVIPSTYVAPSWSWASVIGRIATYRRSNYHSIARVESFTVSLVDQQNPYGNVKAASLTLEGQVLEMIAEKREPHKLPCYPWSWEGAQGWMGIHFSWDDGDQGSRILGDTWTLVCIGERHDQPASEDPHLQGLILKPIERTLPCGLRSYKRVGYWGGRWVEYSSRRYSTILNFESIKQQKFVLI